MESMLGLPFCAIGVAIFAPKIFHGIPDVRDSSHTFVATFGRRDCFSPYLCPCQIPVEMLEKLAAECGGWKCKSLP
jgi:hypothetical protein